MRSPNLETSLILRRWIEADFHNNFVHNDPRAREVWNRIEQADCHQLRLALEAAIAPVSYHVLNPKECVYEVFLGTLLRCAVGADQWALRYELEVGHGRADLIMWENNGTSAILLELKRLSNAEAAINHGQDLDTRLSARAQDAVQQVQDRQYANGLPDHTLSLQVYGIAWHKKRCQVAGINIVRQPNMLWSAALVTPQAGSV